MRKIGITVLAFVLAACTAFAQYSTQAVAANPAAAVTTAPTAQGFSGESDAVAISYNGAWSAGTLVNESYDFMDFGKTKTNHIYLLGTELIAPTPGFSIYAGGIRYEPDLTKLFSKTNVQPGSFSAYVNASVGSGVPSVGTSHIAFVAGGGVKYEITRSLTWQTLQAGYIRNGAQGGSYLSTGLSFIFGKPAK